MSNTLPPFANISPSSWTFKTVSKFTLELPVNFSEIIKTISFETFSDVIAVSPRKVRESLFSHYGIKAKGRSILSSVKEKKETRIKHLQTVLRDVKLPKEQEFLKELFRNWLFRQRPLLKTTLDFLDVPNDEGLVEIETDFFKELSEKKVEELIKHLDGKFSRDAILIYLNFMEVPHLDKYLKS
jgi:hypothetical protein